MKNKGKLDWLINGSIITVLLLLVVLTLYPFYYVIVSSLSQPALLMSNRGLIWWPLGQPTLAAYEMVIFRNPMIPVGYANTLIYVVLGTALNIVMTTLAAYALSRKRAKLVTPIMLGVTFTMLFSGGMIPLFLLVRNLGWINSRLSQFVPTAISVYNMIIMRTSFYGIPDSLTESAEIDGANDWTIMFRIVLPLSGAVVAVMVLFYSVAHWNSWFPAMLYLRKRELYPLQLVLREILITNNTDSMSTGAAAADQAPIGIAIQYATIIVATLPIMLVYPFAQKYFVKGVMIGAIKG